jgi:hypothetical protein
MRADEELRDMAVEVSDALAASRRALGKTLAPQEKTIQRATGLSFADTVEQAHSLQNRRLLNFEALEENTQKFGGFDDRKDLTTVQRETDEILEDIDTFNQTVEDKTLAAEVRTIIAAEQENVKLAESHVDALVAAFNCRVG